MFKLLFQTSIYSILFFTSCTLSNDTPENKVQLEPVDSFESALPHGASLPNSQLSDEDKLKLAKAAGKEAKLISFDSLKQIIERDSSGWSLYHFWNLDCDKCLQINDHLHSMDEALSSRISIKFVNTISLFPDQVNAYIREKGIIQEVFTFPADTLIDWSGQIYQTWDGSFPALLLVNNTDGTKLFYQQAFTKEELQAILETLTL